MTSSAVVVIGAQRAGTTLLWHLLGSHPAVEPGPLRPEPRFFLRGDVDTRDRRAWDRVVFGGDPTPGVVRLEKSTTYLERGDAARRLADCLPDAVVVAVLRDPVDRALSNYWFTHQHGLEDLSPDRAFDEAAQHRPHDPSLSTSPYHYLRRGRYADLLRPWAATVGDRLVLLRHEDVTAPGAALDDLLRRLGLEPVAWPARPDRVNASARGDQDDAAVRASLARYFAGPNDDLAREFGVDVSSWQAPTDDHHQPRRDLGDEEGLGDAGDGRET